MFTSETRWYDNLVLTSTVVPLTSNWPVSDFPQHRLVFPIDVILGSTAWYVLFRRVVDDRCICTMYFSLFRLEVKWNLGLSFANLLTTLVEDLYSDEFKVTIPSILPCLASNFFLITTHNTLPLNPMQRRRSVSAKGSPNSPDFRGRYCIESPRVVQ